MLSLYLTEGGNMAIHIKDVIELLDCVKEARKILNNLNGDTVVETATISRFVNKTDKLLENIDAKK